jgi:uncharacterized protein YjeT (DUF2065 family)
MERAVEVFAGIHLVVIGLSHLIQPRVWVDFFVRLRTMGHAGVFVNGFMSLWFGSIIVAFHNEWSGWATVLTALGWAQVLKGLLCFVMPQLNMSMLNRVSYERAWHFRVGGVVLLALGGLCAWLAVRTPAA